MIVDPLGGGSAALMDLDEGETEHEPKHGGSLWAIASAALEAQGDGESELPILVADLLNARPACARLAQLVEETEAPAVTFAAVAADGVFVAGVLVHTLLEELDRGAVLDDGAGIAVGVAGADGDLHSGLLLSERGRTLEQERPSMIDGIAQLDMIGLVGQVTGTPDQPVVSVL